MRLQTKKPTPNALFLRLATSLLLAVLRGSDASGFGGDSGEGLLLDSSAAVAHHHHMLLERGSAVSSADSQNGYNLPEFGGSSGQPSGGQTSSGNHHGESSSDYYYPTEPQTNNNNHESFDSGAQHSSSSSIIDNNNRQHSPDNKEYLSHSVAEKACRMDRGCQRKDRLNSTYLSYCSRYKVENLFSNDVLMSIMHESVEECDKILDEFIQLDEMISHFDRLFKNLLTRYNCHNGYSVKWSCDDCKKAYKDWLCATNLPYYMNGERIKPCISFCERVEQRCPYLHPITKEQYGGQPVFICRDPNIPFVPSITPDIPYSEPAKCYDLCHLSDNLTELITDSLSKYDYDKCPDKGSIAEEVRSDPLYCRLDYHQGATMTNNDSKTSHGHQQPHDPYDAGGSGGSSTPEETLATEYPGGGEMGGGTTGSDEHSRPTSYGGAGGRRPTAPAVHVHMKKLNELREVVTIYKSQPKTHKFGHHSIHGSLTASSPQQSSRQEQPDDEATHHDSSSSSHMTTTWSMAQSNHVGWTTS